MKRKKSSDFKARKKKRENFFKNEDNLKAKQLKIKCSKCKKTQKITVNDLSIYNDKVLKNYVCWRCR